MAASWAQTLLPRLALANRAQIARDYFQTTNRTPTCRGLAAYAKAFVHADSVFALYVGLGAPETDWAAAKRVGEECYNARWAWDMMSFEAPAAPRLALCTPFLYLRDAGPEEACDAADIYRFFLFATARLGVQPMERPAEPIHVDWVDYRRWHEQWALQQVARTARASSVKAAFCITGGVRHLDKQRVFEGIRRHVVDSANASVSRIFYVLNVAPERFASTRPGPTRNFPNAAWISAALRHFWSPHKGNYETQAADLRAAWPGQPPAAPPGDAWPQALGPVFAALPPTAVFTEPSETAPDLLPGSACGHMRGAAANGTLYKDSCNWQFAGLERCYEQVQQYERVAGWLFDLIYRVRTDLVFSHDVGDARLFKEGVTAESAAWFKAVADEFAIMTRAYAKDYFSAREYGPCLPQRVWDEGLCDTDPCQCRLRFHLDARHVPLRHLRRQYLRPTSWD